MPNHLAEVTAHIVAGYVEKNPVAPGALPDLIANVASSLANLGQVARPVEPELVPPVDPKRTVRPDYIISLEDGKKYKSLKRHLGVRGLSPEEYRKKWNLPPNYPMVASDYSAARSALAKASGLGRKPKAVPKSKRKSR